MGRSSHPLSLQRFSVPILLLALIVFPGKLAAFSFADGILVLGMENEIGLEYTVFEESNKEYLPGDSEAEWDEFMEDNELVGIGDIKGVAIITAFPLIMEFTGGVDAVESEFLLERAYVSLIGNSVSASLGKQDVIWGNGVLYYPLFFPELLDRIYGFRTRDFELPQHWIADMRIDSAAQQLTFRGIVDEKGVESTSAPDWCFGQFYHQIYLSSATLAYQLAYKADLLQENHFLIPGIEFNILGDGNISWFGGFSGETSILDGSFDPEASLGVSWLAGDLFLSAESYYYDWYEIGLFMNYDIPDTAFSSSLTLKFDPIGLGYMGVFTMNLQNTFLDMETGIAFMDGTDRTYYGNSPVRFKLFTNLTLML